MQQLSGLDASFLYLETDNAPMHIGGVSILERDTPRGPLDFAAFRELMRARAHVSRTFTQRLVEVPWNLGRPYWQRDSDFDLDAHVHRTQLPAPGGWQELAALMAWEFSQRLDRQQPLWDLLYVEGVDAIAGVPAGSIALISRVHHAAIDGVSGAELLAALFDVSPEPRQIPVPAPSPADAAPSRLGMLMRSGTGLLEPRALGKTVGATVKGALKAGAMRLKRVAPPPFPFTAPRTRLNLPVTSRRTWAPALLDLDRIRALRQAVAGATVNDVVLAICAGALRRYLLEKDELPVRPLIAMVPVSVRSEDERGAMGNQVSAMLVSLATDEEDPLARLAEIQRGTTRSKIYHQAIGARTLSDYSSFVPFALAGVGARLYTRMRLARGHNPAFNVVITNVPGPRVPLYVGGARLVHHVGAAPIFDGIGLILPIFSYQGTLAIGATSCHSIMPDIATFGRYLATAIDDLESAAARRSAATEQPTAEL